MRLLAARLHMYSLQRCGGVASSSWLTRRWVKSAEKGNKLLLVGVQGEHRDELSPEFVRIHIDIFRV